MLNWIFIWGKRRIWKSTNRKVNYLVGKTPPKDMANIKVCNRSAAKYVRTVRNDSHFPRNLCDLDVLICIIFFLEIHGFAVIVMDLENLNTDKVFLFQVLPLENLPLPSHPGLKYTDCICGPMLGTEPNVVWLLVIVLVVAVMFMTTTFAYDCLLLSSPSVPTLCLKDPWREVDAIQPDLLMGTAMGLNQKLPASLDRMSHAQLTFLYDYIPFLTVIFKTRTRKIHCTKWPFLSLWSTDVVVKMKIKQNPSTLKTENKRPALDWPSETINQLFQVNTSFEPKDTYFKDPLIFEIHIKLKYIYFNFCTLIKYLTACSATHIHVTTTEKRIPEFDMKLNRVMKLRFWSSR